MMPSTGPGSYPSSANRLCAVSATTSGVRLFLFDFSAFCVGAFFSTFCARSNSSSCFQTAIAPGPPVPRPSDGLDLYSPATPLYVKEVAV